MSTNKVTSESAAKPSSASKAIYITIAVLLVFVLCSLFIRSWLSDRDKLPSGDSAWMINISHQIEVQEKGASLYIPPPWDTRYSRLFSQSLSHSGLQLKRKRSDDKRDIKLIASETGKYRVETEFRVHVSSLVRTEPKKIKLSETNRSQWLSSTTDIKVDTVYTTGVIDRLSKDIASPDELIDKLFDYVSNNIRIKKHAGSDSEKALAQKTASEHGMINALIALLRTAHLPARLVAGVNLQAKAAQQPFYWVEVYDAETWIPLDPVHGYLRNLPAFYIPLRKGDEPLIITEGANVKSTTWKIETVSAPSGLSVSDSRKLTDILDLNRLSPDNRENLGLLLLLPLGVLATEIMRQLMGIRTYGTFTPSLMALAVVHVDRTTAITVFLMVTIIGITIRAYLPNLNLQRTARLAMVFTLVSISMAIIMSGFIYFDPAADSIVVLLPVVVLTMLVDRIYTIADQRGMRTALIRLFWTAVAAFVSLLILLQADWSIWLVAYPEIHALTLAVIVIIGLYQGPKLSEVPALGWLHEPESRIMKSTDKPRQRGQSGDSV
jgi:transglutaminase-like putative cysteine protease